MRSESWLRLMSGGVLVGVFAAGTMFGAALMRLYAPAPAAQVAERPLPPPPGGPGGPLEPMRHELGLDAAQSAKLDAIAQAHGGELQAIARSTQERVRDVLLAIEEELRGSLRPDQIEKLEAWRKRRPPMPPGPGMGPPPGGPGMGPPPGGPGGPGMGPPPPGMGPPPHGPGMGPPPRGSGSPDMPF
jgi:hypothetical protein